MGYTHPTRETIPRATGSWSGGKNVFEIPTQGDNVGPSEVKRPQSGGGATVGRNSRSHHFGVDQGGDVGPRGGRCHSGGRKCGNTVLPERSSNRSAVIGSVYV